MIAFFQVLFFLCSIILIVLNIFDLRRYLEKRQDTKSIPYRLNWLYFILTTLVALGCFLNILVGWVKHA